VREYKPLDLQRLTGPGFLSAPSRCESPSGLRHPPHLFEDHRSPPLIERGIPKSSRKRGRPPMRGGSPGGGPVALAVMPIAPVAGPLQGIIVGDRRSRSHAGVFAICRDSRLPTCGVSPSSVCHTSDLFRYFLLSIMLPLEKFLFNKY